MEWDESRKAAHQLIDWVYDYRQNIGDYPVLSNVSPGFLSAQIPSEPPFEPEKFEDVLKDFENKILPGVTHWHSPNFFAYFPVGASLESLFGDILSTGLSVQGMLWETSPSCTELETLVLDWYAKAIDLPVDFQSTNGKGGGVIQGTASEAILVALVAARDKKLKELNGVGDGNIIAKLVAYCSDQTHSCCVKGCKIAGILNYRIVATDPSDCRLTFEKLKTQVEKDISDGFFPFFCATTHGTTGVGAFDDIENIGKYCEETKIWHHVDGAWAGSAAICKEYRIPGVETANSFVFNPHKWLLIPFDCSVLFVKERNDIINALSITPEFLRNKYSDKGMVIDYRDWQIPLGRRFRSLKIWFNIRLHGISGLQKYIYQTIDMAIEFQKMLQTDDRFEEPYQRSLALVLFRLKGKNELSSQLLSLVRNTVFMTHNVINGVYFIRFVVGSSSTTMEHVVKAWELIQSTATKVLAEEIE